MYVYTVYIYICIYIYIYVYIDMFTHEIHDFCEKKHVVFFFEAPGTDPVVRVD